MSIYTNDVDTLRQMLSQSIPQVFSAIVSMVTVLISMLTTNVYLTLVVLAMVVVMIFVARYLGGNSSRFFVKQQEDIGKVDGYIDQDRPVPVESDAAGGGSRTGTFHCGPHFQDQGREVLHIFQSVVFAVQIPSGPDRIRFGMGPAGRLREDRRNDR